MKVETAGNVAVASALLMVGGILAGSDYAVLFLLAFLPTLVGGLSLRRRSHTGRRILLVVFYLSTIISAYHMLGRLMSSPFLFLMGLKGSAGNEILLAAAVASTVLIAVAMFIICIRTIVYLHSEAVREQCNKPL